MTRHRVASLGDITESQPIAVDVGDKRIALFRSDGELYALDETCPHRGAPLHQGALHGGVVTCPWHQWQFDLRTGCSPVNPLSRVATYPVEVEGDAVFIDVEDS